MKKISVLVIITSALFLVCHSCKNNAESERMYKEEPAVMMDMAAPEASRTFAPPPPPRSEVTELPVSRKIIRDGNMEIRVADLDTGKAAVDALVKAYKGYYSNESFNNTGVRTYSLVIRIPAESFDAFMVSLESGKGEVVFKNVSTRDVTEEYVDLETRLANKRNYLNRYNELLKQAKAIKDIVDIQDKSRVIEEEIESTEGRLKYLNNQVQYSTLSLILSKKNDYSIYSNPERGNFFDRLKLAIVKGWFGLVSFALFVIRIWPFWIISGAIFLLARKIIRKRKLNKAGHP